VRRINGFVQQSGSVRLHGEQIEKKKSHHNHDKGCNGNFLNF
jgi:ABC-type branched-subunit amino acid transport system ATPase component